MSTARSAASPAGQQAANDPLARLLALKRTVVMGILNVTPDSFSDGGQFNEPARAIVHARRMADEGADILDIGAESSRPYVGMTPVSEDDELARLKPVLPAVVKLGLPVSIDTIKANLPYIGHFHTGGVPGRHEIDAGQEINYPRVCKAILETGFSGYFAHEFIPERDPLASLREAVKLCSLTA